MEKEELKILEELRRILNSKNEAIVILNNYFKGGVGKSKLSTMFAKRVNLFDYSLEELQAVHEYWRSMNRYSKQVLNKEKVA